MQGAKNKIAQLIDQGSTFTYETFSTKGQYGYPSAYTVDWLAWRAEVEVAIDRLFSDNSPQAEIIRSAGEVVVLGNGEDKFRLVKQYYLGALESARKALEGDDPFGMVRTGSTAPGTFSKKVFVVHGHDEIAKNELEIMLRELGLDPVILHRQPDGGKTIIEKFEAYSDVGYAFILATPDEVSYIRDQDKLADESRSKEYRARPNVIFEFGFFVGRIGRSRVCCLLRGDVSLPSDLSGLVYKKFDKRVDEVGYQIIKELKAAGYRLS